MSDPDETTTPIIPPAVVATVPTPPAAFVLCDRCGVETVTARVLPCGHGLGPVCEARDGADPCPTCTGRPGIDRLPVKAEDEDAAK